MSVTATTATGTTTSAGTTKTSLGKDDFMKLMMEQMKNQDPMNPMDGSQMAAQLAQFSSLEQLTNMNTTLTSSVAANYQLAQSINDNMAPALIGKQVKIQGGAFSNNGENDITLGYKLPGQASKVTVNIMNSSGVVVKTITDADKTTGEHKLSWDYTDNDGNKVPTGDYTFSVAATDSNGADLTTSICKYGLISAVRFTSAGTKIVIGNSEYSLSDVEEVDNP